MIMREGGSIKRIECACLSLRFDHRISHKLAEMMYAQAQQEGEASGGDSGSADSDVVDAEFEDVDDKDKK